MNKKQAKIRSLRSIYGFICMMCETGDGEKLTEYLEEDVQGGTLASVKDAIKVQKSLIEEGLKIARRLKKLEN
jgi:hypothetical protein